MRTPRLRETSNHPGPRSWGAAALSVLAVEPLPFLRLPSPSHPRTCARLSSTQQSLWTFLFSRSSLLVSELPKDGNRAPFVAGAEPGTSWEFRPGSTKFIPSSSHPLAMHFLYGFPELSSIGCSGNSQAVWRENKRNIKAFHVREIVFDIRPLCSQELRPG